MALAPSATLVVAAAAVYLVTLAIYRLFFHPLSKFPGPRAAALSFWYEGYYEIVKVGQYSTHISKLHDRYGPVVRVTPDELHIRDSRFFDDFYAKNLHLDKEGWNLKFGTEGGVLTTVNGAFHKRRRAALSPMYALFLAICLFYTNTTQGFLVAPSSTSFTSSSATQIPSPFACRNLKPEKSH
jgi:hypothetical protein